MNVDLYDDGDAIDEECTLFGWSQSMVVEAAKALSATPFDVVAGHYDAQKLSEADVSPMRHLWDADDLGYLQSYHEDLVKFFESAAASGSAAIRYFNF